MILKMKLTNLVLTNGDHSIQSVLQKGQWKRLKNGDNRGGFQYYYWYDYLYAWDVFDKLGLLHFTCAILSEDV